jgi:phospholipid-binding lipoprotein MlaA
MRLPTTFGAALVALTLAQGAGAQWGPNSVPAGRSDRPMASTSTADPFEPANRLAFQFNQALDDALILPITRAYIEIVPRAIRAPISNFYNNLEDVFSAINGLLQGKVDKAGHDLGRVMVNSSFGIFGLLDFASDAGIPRGEEDFGQTFAVWGAPQGPFLVIPFFGPTTGRDGTGLVVRILLDPTRLIEDDLVAWSLWGVQYINLRAELLEAQELVQGAALDPYAFTRRAFLQRRAYLIYDGNPPPPKDDE